MKNLKSKIKKTLFETEEGTITVPAGTDKVEGYTKITKDKYDEYNAKGCTVAKGDNNKYYLKKGSCPTEPTEEEQTEGDWKDSDSAKCIRKNLIDTNPTDFTDGCQSENVPSEHRASYIKSVCKDIVLYFKKGTELEEKHTFKEDGTYEHYINSENKTYTGYWKCDGEKLVIAQCENGGVYTDFGSGYQWKIDVPKAKELGCTSLVVPVTSKWNKNCGTNNMLKKGCWDDEVERLQECLNQKKDSKLEPLVVDGKWGKKTQLKLEEFFYEYRNGVKKEEITEICQVIQNQDKKKEEEIIKVDDSAEKPKQKKKRVFTVVDHLIKRIKTNLLMEQLSNELVTYANNYIDSNDCPKIKSDMEKFRDSGAVTNANDLSELKSKIRTLGAAITFNVCPKDEMKKEFGQMAQEEPEKLKTYMCWFSKNISVPSTPLATCNESNNVAKKENTMDKATDNMQKDDQTKTNNNTQQNELNTNTNISSTEYDNEIKGSLSYLSDDEFFNLALTFRCLPTYPNQNAWLTYPKLTKIDDGSSALVGESKNTQEKYAFYRNFTVENLNTGKTQKWYCDALKNYAPKIARPTKILEKFGVDSNIETEKELTRALNNVTRVLQYYVNQRAVSDDIMEWKTMLDDYYSNYPNVTKLTLPNNQDIYLPEQDDLTLKYKEPADLTRYNFKNVVVYLPKRTEKLAVEGPLDGQDKTSCVNYLKTYLGHAILRAAGVEAEPMDKLDVYRASIVNCANSGQYSGLIIKKDEVLNPSYYGNLKRHPFDKYGRDFEWRDVVKFLKGETNDKPFDGSVLKLPDNYAITLQEGLLKNKIKSTLNEVVLNKRKKLVTENLIKKRVEVLFENTKFKSRQQRREFVINLVREAVFVETLSSDKKLIKEEFWDVVKGFFGDEGTGSVFQSFKTRMGEWLTSHLSPKKADGWVGDCIRTTIHDIDMRDVHKITDCKFLTKEIARSIIEKLNEKMSNEELKDEGLYDIVRGGMADNVKSARFREHIEDKVSNMICPILYGMSNKFDSMFDAMKKRAVGL